MSHYCIFKDVNSLDLGLYMERCPEKMIPSRRDETVVISGRHGNLTLTDGSFDTYIRQAEFIIKDKTRIDDICAHFRGSGWLIFDTEPYRKYKARISNKVEISHILRDLKRFAVEFEIQPFGYEINPQTIEKIAPFSLFNMGTFESEPVITVFGSGNITLYVNNQSVVLSSISSSITLNSETLNAYSGSTSLNNKMNGEFPKFQVGENTINWTGNVTKIEVQPNWRWF